MNTAEARSHKETQTPHNAFGLSYLPEVDGCSAKRVGCRAPRMEVDLRARKPAGA
jgi:hypothetical protein